MGMKNEMFCTSKEVYNLIQSSTREIIDPVYFNTIMDLSRRKMGESFKYTFNGDDMDLSAFLVCISVLKDWYRFSYADVGSFIEKKFAEKYRITRTDILSIISTAMNDKPVAEETPKKRSGRKPVGEPVTASEDMYKTVQNALSRGMTRVEVMKKYGLTQRELVMYEGWKYWNDSQRNDHKTMLEYRRLHPDATDKETIEKGCKKDAASYRYALIPTKEQQEEYNANYKDKKAEVKSAPKAVIKGTDIKSLILSDAEKEEQQELYSKIKEIASARNISSRDVTSLLKSRMVKDYGIVIEQIKKELMMKYRVNRGEGKAPNTLEAIVMSEYLPIAKSILDDMLTESFSVR